MNDVSGRIPFNVSFGVTLLVNFTGNSTICAVILRNKFMRTPVNYLLFNLAIADIMVGVFTLPGPYFLGPYLYTHPGGTLGDLLCKTITGKYGSLIAIGLFVSALTLSAIAYERYQAVVLPFTVKEKVTTRKVFLLIAFIWTVAFGVQIFPWLVYHFDNSTKACEITRLFQNDFTIYVKYLGSILFGISFVFMVAFYGRVIWELRRKQDQILNRDQLAANRVHKRITFMLITITVIFAATWGAGAVIANSFVTNFSGRDLQLGSRISALLLSINSCVNCFLYALCSSQFRKGVKNLLQICRKNHQLEIANDTNRHDTEKTGENSRSVEQLEVIETKL